MNTKPSKTWLAQYKKTLVPEMFLDIAYHSADNNVQNNATVSSADKLVNDSHVTDIGNEITEKLGTFEKNLFVLDDSFSVKTDDTAKSRGYISSSFVSKDVHPVVLITFNSVQTKEMEGLTIEWSRSVSEFAKSFSVTVKNGSETLLTKEVKGNSSIESYVELGISSFDAIQIEVKEWCISERRARIEGIEFGRVLKFDKSNILSYTHESKRDPISGQLSKDSISFSIDNSAQTWNPVNPNGLYGYIYERQELFVKYGMKLDGNIEWINGGRFFLSGWNVPSNGISASFEARDALSFLMDTDYTGRKYGTLYEMCYDALELLRVSGITYSISDELKNYSTDITSGNSSYKNADILQLAANAAGMALYQNRDGIIKIERVPYAVTDSTEIQEIDEVNNYQYPEITFSSKIKNVSCKVGNSTKFYPSEASSIGATQSISNEMITESILNNGKNALTESYALLSNRRKATLEYRASPHNDAFDVLKIRHQFGYSSNILATDIKYTFSGSFRGTVEGYIIENISSVVLNMNDANIDYGEQFDVTATVVPSVDGSPAISWSASNDCVTIETLSNAAGRSVCRVKWNKKGTVTLTASVSNMSTSMNVNCIQSAVSKLAEGSSVYITHKGVKTEYVVARHNYEPLLNGKGRTLLVSKNFDGTSAWNASGQNAYADSTIDKLLSNDYLNGFSTLMQAKIAATKFYYTPGYSISTNVSTLSRRVFLLSLTELSENSNESSGFNKEGTLLSCYESLIQVPKYKFQWTRTCVYDASATGLPSSYNNLIAGCVQYISSEESFDGKEYELASTAKVTDTYTAFRAAFTIPSITELYADGSLIEE